MHINATFALAIKGLKVPDGELINNLDEFTFNYQLEGEYTPEELTTTVTSLVDIFKMAIQADQPKVEVTTPHQATLKHITRQRELIETMMQSRGVSKEDLKLMYADVLKQDPTLDEAPSGLFSDYTQVDPSTSFRTCPKCGSRHTDAQVCPYCGGTQ